jgi:hypothetical protein
MSLPVSRWKAIFSLLCLAVWLPATQHCQLERLPGLAFLHCAADTPGNSDCRGDSCDTVERGMYKTPDNASMAVVPVLAVMLVYTTPAVKSSLPKFPGCGSVMAAPSRKRAESWQSYSALALPIRGPSLTS